MKITILDNMLQPITAYVYKESETTYYCNAIIDGKLCQIEVEKLTNKIDGKLCQIEVEKLTNKIDGYYYCNAFCKDQYSFIEKWEKAKSCGDCQHFYKIIQKLGDYENNIATIIKWSENQNLDYTYDKGKHTAYMEVLELLKQSITEGNKND